MIEEAVGERATTTEERLLALGKGVLVVFLAFLGAVVAASLADGALRGVGVGPDTLAHRVLVSSAQFLGFGLGVAGYLGAADDWALVRDRLRSPTLRDAGYLVGGAALLVVAATLIGQALARLGVDVAQNQAIAAGRENPTYFLWMIPVSVLLVGPFEELVFRGGLQGHLRRAWGPAPAVVLASAGFGAVHLFALGGSGSRVTYLAVAAVLGVVLGAAYERTENLLVPAGAHGLYNATLFLVQYLSATGAV
ncbi:MAG: lysostaphin resistance A-like protein [Haloferacaceae archaeon]